MSTAETSKVVLARTTSLPNASHLRGAEKQRLSKEKNEERMEVGKVDDKSEEPKFKMEVNEESTYRLIHNQ